MLSLVSLNRADWDQLADEPARFAADRGLTIGADAEILRPVAQQMVASFQRTGVTGPPWSGFVALDQARRLIVGVCGFKGPPDDEGVVEIAYFTFPGHEGQGYASQMAAGLVRHGSAAPGVRRVRAHTLPEPNASTRILEKTGFAWCGEVVDPEDGPVWRWERAPMLL